CGCAFVDYDSDGWMAIFLLRGTRLGGHAADATNRLYRNSRDGTFTDVTEKSGLQAVGWACGVCIGDYDNDGFDDIFCTYFGQNRLYHNNGDGAGFVRNKYRKYRRIRRCRSLHLFRTKPALSQQWGWNLYRRDEGCRAVE